jgi:hypothetical protein
MSFLRALEPALDRAHHDPLSIISGMMALVSRPRLVLVLRFSPGRCRGRILLSEGDRRDLVIQASARSATICDLSDRHGVSRKFIYQQAHKVSAVLDDVFLSGTPEELEAKIGRTGQLGPDGGLAVKLAPDRDLGTRVGTRHPNARPIVSPTPR